MANPIPVSPPPPPPPPPPRASQPPRPAPPPPRLSFGQRAALNVAPLFLRLVLGATMLWVGLGQVMTTIQVQGDDAVTLYNLGVIDGPARPKVPPADSLADDPLHDPATNPFVDPPAEQPPAEQKPDDPGPLSRGPSKSVLVGWQPAPKSPRLASDFATPVEVPALHRTTLMLWSASRPMDLPDGTVGAPILPAWMGSDPWARVQAWAWAVIHLLGGAFLLLGLGTRIWAFLVGKSLGMMIWLTEIGPAVQRGDALLGFLPAGRDAFDAQAWMPLLWLLALLCICLSLLFSGAGALSIDRAIFRRRDHDDD